MERTGRLLSAVRLCLLTYNQAWLRTSHIRYPGSLFHSRILGLPLPSFGAGKPNLSKIASANAGSAEVKEALLTLARKGLLVKPDGLNKWEEKK